MITNRYTPNQWIMGTGISIFYFRIRTYIHYYQQKISTSCDFSNLYIYILEIVHFDAGAEGDYLFTRFARAKTSHELKIFLRTSFEPYFIPREPNNHIKVMILRLEWYKFSSEYIKKLETHAIIVVNLYC